MSYPVLLGEMLPVAVSTEVLFVLFLINIKTADCSFNFDIQYSVVVFSILNKYITAL